MPSLFIGNQNDMVKKVLSVLASATLITGSVTSTSAWTYNKTKTATTKKHENDECKIQPYGSIIYNSRHIWGDDAKYGLFINFYITPRMYNWLDLAIEGQTRGGSTALNLFHKVFLDQRAKTPLEWRNMLKNYDTKIKKIDKQYRNHKFEDDLLKYLSFQESGSSYKEQVENFYSLFSGSKSSSYRSHSVDPMEKSYPNLNSTFRTQGAILQLAFSNYGSKDFPDWSWDFWNTRIMVWNNNNDLLSHYYYQTYDKGLDKDPSSLFIPVKNKKSIVLRDIRSNFYEAIKDQFGFQGYSDIEEIIKLDPSIWNLEVDYVIGLQDAHLKWYNYYSQQLQIFDINIYLVIVSV